MGNTPMEKTPRSFDLDPEGKFLLAAGESSGKLAVYQVDADSGDLKPAATYMVDALVGPGRADSSLVVPG